MFYWVLIISILTAAPPVPMIFKLNAFAGCGLCASVAAGCPFGWEFDRTVFAETAATTYLWVCDQKAEETRLLTVATIGNLVGSIVFGMLSDRYLPGRKLRT